MVDWFPIGADRPRRNIRHGLRPEQDRPQHQAATDAERARRVGVQRDLGRTDFRQRRVTAGLQDSRVRHVQLEQAITRSEFPRAGRQQAVLEPGILPAESGRRVEQGNVPRAQVGVGKPMPTLRRSILIHFHPRRRNGDHVERHRSLRQTGAGGLRQRRRRRPHGIVILRADLAQFFGRQAIGHIVSRLGEMAKIAPRFLQDLAHLLEDFGNLGGGIIGGLAVQARQIDQFAVVDAGDPAVDRRGFHAGRRKIFDRRPRALPTAPGNQLDLDRQRLLPFDQDQRRNCRLGRREEPMAASATTLCSAIGCRKALSWTTEDSERLRYFKVSRSSARVLRVASPRSLLATAWPET